MRELLSLRARARRSAARLVSLLAALILVALILVASAARTARAQSTITHPGDRTPYRLELEPHVLFGPFDPPGAGSGDGLGLGARASFEVAPDGFIPKLNDSVAIGIGLDWLHYAGRRGPTTTCRQFVQGPAGTPVCVEVDGLASNYVYFPVVMQWNFWLARQWSVFAEPGLSLYLRDGSAGFAPLVLFAGGRFHASERIALTFRVGYPTLSLGASFFF